MNTITFIHSIFLLITVFGGFWVVRWGMKQFIDDSLPTGFPSAGKIIGILERSLFWICLYINQAGLIGFILTLKAIYRYGDIQGEDRQKMRLSEYFIIGTLYSLGWTLLVWVVMEKIIQLLI